MHAGIHAVTHIECVRQRHYFRIWYMRDGELQREKGGRRASGLWCWHLLYSYSFGVRIGAALNFCKNMQKRLLQPFSLRFHLTWYECCHICDVEIHLQAVDKSRTRPCLDIVVAPASCYVHRAFGILENVKIRLSSSLGNVRAHSNSRSRTR